LAPPVLIIFLPVALWLFLKQKTTAVLLILCFIAGALVIGTREYGLKRSDIASFADKKISITIVASIRTDPKLGIPKEMMGIIRPATTTALISVISFSVRGKKFFTHLPMRLTTQERITYLPGTVFSSRGIIYSSAEKKVAGLFVARGSLSVLHGAGMIGRIAGSIRSRFREIAIRAGGASGALIPGLVLGDTSLESHAFSNEMVAAGLTHLTAVSGENFAIIAAFMGWLLQWFFRSLRVRLLVSSIVLVGFIVLVRPSPSVLRATVMVAVLILGRARGVKSSGIPALALAVGLLILIDPFEAIDPGFALSVVATAGILLFASPLAEWLNGYLHNLRFAQLLAIPLSANLLCTPIAIAISGQFTLMSLPSNLLVEPMVAPITIVGFVAALFTSTSPGLAYLLVLSQKPFAAEIVWVAHACSRVPVVRLSGGFLGAGIGILATMMVWIAIRWGSWA